MFGIKDLKQTTKINLSKNNKKTAIQKNSIKDINELWSAKAVLPLTLGKATVWSNKKINII